MKESRKHADRWQNLPDLSVWSDGLKKETSKSCAISGDRQTEVLIVGGGLAGILTAWQLTQAGVSCIVAEARSVGSGVTKNTTAKITAQHGLIYDHLIGLWGTEKARLYYDANIRAIEEYRSLAAVFPCHFEEKHAYVYTQNDRSKLEREAAAYEKLGIRTDIEAIPGLPVQNAGCLRMDKQAQFNPLEMVTALSEQLEIAEHTFVRDIDGNKAITDRGTIEAEHIILATHFPMINIPGLYFLKLYQHRSYVLALKGASLPEGMFVDEQQTGYSFRSYGDLLLFGGGDHKTGKQGGNYQELADFTASMYPQAEIKYRWATQDCMTLDSVPYIGRHQAGKQNLYVATGFNKWGMSNSMIASKLLSDLVLNRKSDLAELYSPQRSIMTKQLAINIGSATKGLLSPGGPRCPHMGCKLQRNTTEQTWDCPCHGSRFNKTGQIIDNPTKRDCKNLNS
ncbi:MAG: FAD-dependent oxidoreductase [Lachnospiraceae bacterium]